MQCQYCHHTDTKVIDKRTTPDGNTIRRRRECQNCQRRFTTYERSEDIALVVLKKDNTKVPFDRSKILLGIQRACIKRPVTAEQINAIVDKIERILTQKDSKEITTKRIGETIIRELKKLDAVAYIRFASVYRSFEDVDEFAQELKRITK